MISLVLAVQFLLLLLSMLVSFENAFYILFINSNANSRVKKKLFDVISRKNSRVFVYMRMKLKYFRMRNWENMMIIRV